MKTRVLRSSSSVGDLVAPPAGLARPREDLRARDAARAVQTLVVAMIALGKRTGLAAPALGGGGDLAATEPSLAAASIRSRPSAGFGLLSLSSWQTGNRYGQSANAPLQGTYDCNPTIAIDTMIDTLACDGP